MTRVASPASEERPSRRSIAGRRSRSAAGRTVTGTTGRGRRGRRDRVVLGAQVGAVAALVAAWQLAPESLLPPYAVAKPVDTVSALWSLTTEADLLSDLVATLRGMALGLVIGALVGVSLAAAIELRPVRWLLDPLVIVTNAVPKIALISLFILWLGLNERSHLALVISFIIFVFYFSTRQALEERDMDRETALRMLGARRVTVARLLTLPSMTPHLLGALRVAMPLAFSAQIFGELRIPTEEGLGSVLARQAQFVNASNTTAIVLVVCVIGYLLDVIIGRRLSAFAKATGGGEVR